MPSAQHSALGTTNSQRQLAAGVERESVRVNMRMSAIKPLVPSLVLAGFAALVQTGLPAALQREKQVHAMELHAQGKLWPQVEAAAKVAEPPPSPYAFNDAERELAGQEEYTMPDGASSNGQMLQLMTLWLLASQPWQRQRWRWQTSRHAAAEAVGAGQDVSSRGMRGGPRRGRDRGRVQAHAEEGEKGEWEEKDESSDESDSSEGGESEEDEDDILLMQVVQIEKQG